MYLRNIIDTDLIIDLLCYATGNSVDAAEDEIPVVFSSDAGDYKRFNLQFQWDTFRNSLFSQRYGRFVLYSDMIPTGMTVYNGFDHYIDVL